MSSGFGLRLKKQDIKAAEREGTIEEQSVLFGKNMNTVLITKNKEEIKAAAEKFGYGFEVTFKRISHSLIF